MQLAAEITITGAMMWWDMIKMIRIPKPKALAAVTCAFQRYLCVWPDDRIPLNTSARDQQQRPGLAIDVLGNETVLR
jgi:hypothetical protein